MTTLSLLMFTCNDVPQAITALERVKKHVDEIIIIEGSYRDQKTLLNNYAKVNSKIKIYNTAALGMPEPYMKFAISKCSNKWIFILDPDELPSKGMLELLDHIRNGGNPGCSIFYIKRYETHDRKFSTWQLRLFKKGRVEWHGFIHEHPEKLGISKKADAECFIDHKKSAAMRDYNKMQLFFRRPLPIEIMRNSYIAMKTSGPGAMRNAISGSLASGNRTKETNALTRALKEEGITRYLGINDSMVNELYSKYKNKKQGTDLLIKLILAEHRRRVKMYN